MSNNKSTKSKTMAEALETVKVKSSRGVVEIPVVKTEPEVHVETQEPDTVKTAVEPISAAVSNEEPLEPAVIDSPNPTEKPTMSNSVLSNSVSLFASIFKTASCMGRPAPTVASIMEYLVDSSKEINFEEEFIGLNSDYFEGACESNYSPLLAVGSAVNFMYDSCRRVIVIGTKKEGSNLVFFDRVNLSDCNDVTIMRNFPNGFEQNFFEETGIVLSSGPVKLAEFLAVLDYCGVVYQ